MTRVWVFFYGTFMSARVLRQSGMDCSDTFPAKLAGYSLVIRPKVNLVKVTNSMVYGGLAFVEQGELNRLYKKVHETYGHAYYPYPVLAEKPDGLMRPALCFIAEDLSSGDPDPAYIEEMIQCAQEMQAPASYILYIESFKTANKSAPAEANVCRQDDEF